MHAPVPAHTRGSHAGASSSPLTNTDHDGVHVASCLFIINTASTPRQIKHALDHYSMFYSTCFRVGQLLVLLATLTANVGTTSATTTTSTITTTATLSPLDTVIAAIIGGSIPDSTDLNRITGVTGAKDGVDYTKASCLDAALN